MAWPGFAQQTPTLHFAMGKKPFSLPSGPANSPALGVPPCWSHSPPLMPKPEEPWSNPAAEALEREILARDYALDIGSCLRRGWALVKSDFWPLVGITALMLALLSAVSSFGEVTRSVGNVHFNTSALGFLLGGPLMGGLYLYYLKKIRGEPVRVETAFSGFSHSLLHLILASFVTGVLTVLGFFCLILPRI